MFFKGLYAKKQINKLGEEKIDLLFLIYSLSNFDTIISAAIFIPLMKFQVLALF